MWLHVPSACFPSALATGGLDLAVHDAARHLGLRARTVCYVEREAQAAAILAARMEDGGLDAAPVWSDLASFGARAWRGAVDLVCAGFPCQPVSLAGKRLAQDDERWLWPFVQRVINDCGAPFVFLENVPGLVTAGLADVLGGLASLGFDAEWACYSAAEIGAPHRRDRWFCLAYAGRECLDRLQPERERGRGQRGAAEPGPNRGAAADSDSSGCGGAEDVGDANREVLGGLTDAPERQADRGAPAQRPSLGGEHEWPPGPDRIAEWNGPQPAIRRESHGAPGRLGRVDQLRMLGNGVVWQQASFALQDLVQRARGGRMTPAHQKGEGRR